MSKPVQERVWLWYDSFHAPQVAFSKPEKHIESVEYMRVLGHREVQKLAQSTEGVDAQQMIQDQQRTIEGRRQSIRELQKEVSQAARDSFFEGQMYERQGDDYGSF